MERQVRIAFLATSLGLASVAATATYRAFTSDDAPMSQASALPSTQEQAALAARMGGGQSDMSVREACGLRPDAGLRDRCTRALMQAAAYQQRDLVASRFRTFIASFFTLKI